MTSKQEHIIVESIDPTSVFPHDKEVQEKETVGLSSDLKLRFPRMYYFTLRVVLPCWLLVGLTLLFGHIVALNETDGEQTVNDQILANAVISNFTYKEYADEARDETLHAPTDCLDRYVQDVQDQIYNITDLSLYLSSCAEEKAQAAYPPPEYFDHVLQWNGYDTDGTGVDALTFDWTTCPREEEGAPNDKFAAQFLYVRDAWMKSFESFVAEYKEMGGTIDKNTYSMLANRATGHGECDVHSAGGAIYWITVMTTIGTSEYRMLHCYHSIKIEFQFLTSLFTSLHDEIQDGETLTQSTHKLASWYSRLAS